MLYIYCLSSIFFSKSCFLHSNSIFLFLDFSNSSCVFFNYHSNSSIPSSDSTCFLIPYYTADLYNVWYAAKVILCSSLTRINKSPRSGQFMVTCLVISSNAWLKSYSLIEQIPSVLAWRCSSASYKFCFNLKTSSREDLEWLTYCIKYFYSEVYQSLGVIILLSTS